MRAPNPVKPKDFNQNGIWQQQGYGRIMILNDSVATFYDYNRKNCNPSFEEPLAEIGKVLEVSSNSLTILHGINEYHFDKLEKLPTLCDSLHQLDNQNPSKNFEALWSTFNEHYAYFDARNVDWKKEYVKYKSRINNQTTEVELYQILDEMISSIGDGHVGIDAPEELVKESEEESNSENEEVKERSVHSLRQEYKNLVTDYYLKDVKQYNSGVVRWGMMENNIAYVQINWMILLGDYNLETDLSFEEFWYKYWDVAEGRNEQRNDEIDGAHMIIDSIVQELSSAKAFVLDIRFNGGGKDDAALEFISFFANESKGIFSKKAKLEEAYTNAQQVSLKPADNTFTGPVYLLTSPQTASAAEIMTISSMVFPHITRIGGSTEGIFSDMLDKVLPNGWEYSLSNEVYEDAQGNNYENIGIPPHFDIGYSRDARTMYTALLNDFDSGVKKGDNAIEQAISLAQNN